MADEQKRRGNQPNREGQNTDPNRQGQGGQRGSQRERSEESTRERSSERSTGNTETGNRPEGDVEGIGEQSRR